MKYLLDTNVISEVRNGRRAHSAVRKWWSETKIEDWLQSITASMGTRLLVVNQKIADTWGRMGKNRSLPLVDSILAATAVAHDLILVTRNTKDILGTGATHLNPFDA